MRRRALSEEIIESEIADGGRSLILDQVTNGLAVRMAVLYLLAGGAHTVDENQGAQAKDRKIQGRVDE